MSAIAGVSANGTILDPNRQSRERNSGFLNGGRGACWIDYDGDGDDDLYAVGPGRNTLYRNDGNFSFANVTEGSGLDDPGYGMACTSADLDNDGDQDIWVSNFDSYFSIFRNNGNGTFTNLTASAGISDMGAQTGVAFGDFNGDGRLDVFMTEYNRMQDKLYQNLGNFRFQERWNTSNMFDLDFGFQPLVFDADLDGDVDIYVINDFGFDTFWRNDGNWSFRDASDLTLLRDPRGGMGGDVADIDHDQDLDVSVGNYQPNGLWLRNGSSYEDRAQEAGVDNDSTTWATVFFDFDNDGWEDLYVVNGVVDPAAPYHQTNVLYRNLGNRTFEDISAGSGAESREVGRSAALSDVDADGRVDMYVTNVNAPNELLRNVYNTTNRWVGVLLRGLVSNPDGVGALVKVKFGNTTLIKPTLAGTGYLSSHSKVLHFGLGNAASVSSIEVVWPSGLVQTVRNVATNATNVVPETDPFPPVAVARDVVAYQGVPFALNGSNSTDNVGIKRWDWTVDVNGSLHRAEGRVATMAIYTPGTFIGSLEVTDPFSNKNVTWFQVTVLPLNAAWVDAGPDIAVPEGTAVTFRATGGSSATPDFENSSVFFWNFTDAGVPVTLTGPRPSYTFAHIGVIRVVIEVTDIEGNVATDELNVSVLDVTSPAVSVWAPARVDQFAEVTLDASNTTDNDPSFAATGAFSWAYTERTGPVALAGPTVVVEFDTPGNLTVTLTVRDAAGNNATRVFVIMVTDRTPPVPDAGGNKVTLAGQEVILSGSKSTDDDPRFPREGILEWRIFFRTGVVVLGGVTQVVTFPEPGRYRVELDAWDPSGNRAAAPDVIYVDVLDIEPPLANAGGDRTVALGRPVVLDASKSTDNDPTLLETGSFIWEFQDGTNRTKLIGLVQSYTFLRIGEYRARLTVIDAAGNAAAILFTIRVADLDPPVIVHSSLPNEIVAGDTLELNATGTHDEVALAGVSWHVTGPFAYDQIAQGPLAAFVLELPGNYTVLLTAVDESGNIASASFTVRVVPNPASGGGGGGGGTNPPPGGGGNPPGGNTSGGGESPAGLSVPPAVAALVGAVIIATVIGLIYWRRLRGDGGAD